MTTTSNSDVALRSTRDSRTHITHVALALTLLAVGAPAANAQAVSAPKTGFEFLVSSGSLVPTGAQRDAIKRGNMSVAQLSYVVRPGLVLTSSMGWTRSRDLTTIGSPKIDVFTYDAGAEVRRDAMMTARRVSLTPFAGLGAGARSYNYRGLDVDATHNLAGYGSVGGEVGYRRIKVRIEGRDYVTGFKPLSVAGTSSRRNDVAILAGLRYTTR